MKKLTFCLFIMAAGSLFSFMPVHTVAQSRQPKPSAVKPKASKEKTAAAPAQLVKVMRLSRWKGGIQDFLDSALGSGREAVMDVPVTGGGFLINHNGVVRSDTNIQHACTQPFFFQLKPLKRIEIHGFRVQNLHPAPVTFDAGVTSGSELYDSISQCIVTGTGGAYTNSRGGTDRNMRITAISHSRFQTTAVPVSVYSQDGNNRALHLYHMQLSSDSTHCIYVHPSVSLRYDSVAVLFAGKLGQHQFSGSGNGGYNTARYSLLNRIYSEKNGFELTNPAKGPIQLNNSRLAFYTTMGVDIPNVLARDCHITAGLVAGELTNCSGEIWTGAPFTTTVRNSRITMAELRWGGTLIAENCTIEYLNAADRGKNFNAILRNSKVGVVSDGRNGNGKIRLENSQINRKNAREEVIQ